MNFEEFDDYHDSLDSTCLGVVSVDCQTRNIDGLDGSIVLCSDRKKLRDWRHAHGLTAKIRCETGTYGGVMENLSWEGVSYHLDHEAAAIFQECFAKDLRFRPEVLTVVLDEWTLVTSCFDPNTDPTSILRKEMDSFILGQVTPSELIVASPLEQTNAVTPFHYADFKQATKEKLKFDLLARSRLASVSAWENFLEQLEDAR